MRQPLFVFSAMLSVGTSFLCATQAEPPVRQQTLPIRRIALYKNGVGYFEHAGTVTGNERIQLDFTTGQLNDVLQSFTALDLGGGHIAGLGYNSTSPLAQQLGNIPLGLGESPTATELFSALRGARLLVHNAGAVLEGRLLSLETREVVQSGQTGEKTTATKRELTVIGANGVVRVFELTPAITVQMLDTGVQRDLDRYLDLLASTRDHDLRHVTLETRGAGSREVDVSYISEVPVWKSTYRIVLQEAPGRPAADTTATLQGWAVVDNTVGMDWNNVELTLVAGAPQSFLQPISQPYYVRRPEIPLPSEAMMTPQTHEVTVETRDALQPAISGQAGGAVGGVIGGLGSADAPVASAARAGFGTRVGAGVGRDISAAAHSTSQSVTVEPTVAPETRTAAFDDFFEYKLTRPITIRKNESALVPILQEKVAIEPVTLWNAEQKGEPLRALWMKNSSSLTLDRGSFTVLEGSEFAGEGLMDPIHAGERRLLSYAADQAVQITERDKYDRQHTTRVEIANGVLTERKEQRSERTYTVRNAAAEPRNVVIEHPVRNGWKLVSDEKPVETSANTYRFEVKLKPAETGHLTVAESQTLSVGYQLTSSTADQLALLVRDSEGGAELAQALAPVLDARRKLTDLDKQIAGTQAAHDAIVTDQTRLRSNLMALKGTAEERALAKRYTTELNEQEDKLTALNGGLAALQAQHAAAEQTLTQAIEQTRLSTEVRSTATTSDN